MNTFFLVSILSIFCSTTAFSKEVIDHEYSISKVVKSKYVSANQAKVKFTVKNNYPSLNNGKRELIYSVDSKSATVKLTKTNSFFLTLPKGKHIFQFYLGGNHSEIYTDSIDFKGGYQTNIDLSFHWAEEIPVAEKPVIYLYPEVPQALTIQLKPQGEFTFTYPPYSDEWNVTAQPNGTITHEHKNYPYLFWEATMTTSNQLNTSEGFIINREQVVSFLEQQLTTFGLHSTEQTDFITYWAPRLVKEPRVFLQFVWGEDTDQFAELSISPQPDHVNRVYILWKSIEDSELIENPTPQLIPIFDRSGFDVLEWGGIELPKTKLP